MLMAQGIQRARYRNGTCPQLLVPHQPTKVRVDLQSTALVLKPRHKLRVIVSASAGPNHAGGDPLYSVNPQNEDEYTGAHPNVTGSIKVLAGRGHPSALVIPVPTGQTPPTDLLPNTTPCPD
jgi:predicted acyl esterase